MADMPPLPDRIQRDLEDALRQGGVDKLPKRSRRRRRSFRPGVFDPRPRNPGQLVLIGVGLALIGGVLHVPFGQQVLIIGLALVALAMLTYFTQPQGYQRKFWRDRYIDVPTGRWQERLYRLIYRTQ